MGQEGLVIFRLHYVRATAQGLVRVTGMGRYQSAFIRALLQLGQQRITVYAGAGAQVPPDMERIPPFFCRPVVIRQHGNSAGNGHHLANAGDCQGRSGIIAFYPGAGNRYRRTGDYGRQHTGKLHIHAKNSLAVDLGRRIQPPYLLPDQFPVCRVFQGHVGRNGQGRGIFHQLAIADPFTAHDNVAVLRAAVLYGCPEAVGSRLHQQVAGSGAGPAVAVKLREQAGGAAGALCGIQRVIIVWRCRRMFRLYGAPVRIQLVGYQHAKGGPDALSHFATRKENGHGIVCAYTQESIGGEVGGNGRAYTPGCAGSRYCKGDHQSAGSHSGVAEKLPAIERWGCVHSSWLLHLFK